MIPPAHSIYIATIVLLVAWNVHLRGQRHLSHQPSISCGNPFVSAQMPTIKSFNSFAVVLANLDDELISAYRRYFQPYLKENGGLVEVIWEDFQFLKEPYDCIVSPANSFGLMDGGVDWHISYHLSGGPSGLVPHVQTELLKKYAGQQPVASTVVIDIGPIVQTYAKNAENHHLRVHSDEPALPKYLAHTPTMRAPRTLGKVTEIPYDAMWSTLTALREHNKAAEKSNEPEKRIRRVVFPGFGTSYGRVPPKVGARQLALAYKHFLENPADRVDNNATCDAGSEYGGTCRIKGEEKYLMSWDYAEKISSEIQGTWACDY